jgi:hypothetical protein
MMRYALLCEHDHAFEGWFGSSGDYDDQQARGLIDCPMCGSKAVRKAVMSPAVVGPKSGGPPAEVREMMMQAAQAVRQHVEDNFDYVGDHFADEARAIHKGQADPRGIYGEASGSQVQALLEEGVPVGALPPKPPRKTEVN